MKSTIIFIICNCICIVTLLWFIKYVAVLEQSKYNYKEFPKHDIFKKEKIDSYMFDWDKANILIEKSNAKNVQVGMIPKNSLTQTFTDICWKWTVIFILHNGKKITESKTPYCMKPSIDCIPHIKIENKIIPCYKIVDYNKWKFKENLD